MLKILLPVAAILFSVPVQADPQGSRACGVFDAIPEPVQNKSGSVKVTPGSQPEACYSDVDGKLLMNFFYQGEIAIESAKRTNVVMRYALGDDKPLCEKALKDGPYRKSSIIVNKGMNAQESFMANIGTGDIEFKKDAHVCIHIENP